MEKIPGQVGYLIMTEDGFVTNTSGDLENDETTANVLHNMVINVNKRNLLPNGKNVKFHRISVHFQDHVYVIAISNKKIYVSKRRYLPNEPLNV